MTDPIDHRAAAGRALEAAADRDAQGWLGEEVTAVALLAIAHDLHRIADALEPKPVNMLAPVRSANPHGASMGPMRDPYDESQCDARHLGLRCVLSGGHKDSHHRGTWTDA